ncbi:uncharacterized protein LOC101238637 isoform X2 [Hydra vulgaris]|uniref:Uncharacterized protein LOC101238637 isoform X2 n=1 Tax=Hydra vulgaris TaxID=6087 RepID=A0ABM4CIV8_HYDVU
MQFSDDNAVQWPAFSPACQHVPTSPPLSRCCFSPPPYVPDIDMKKTIWQKKVQVNYEASPSINNSVVPQREIADQLLSTPSLSNLYKEIVFSKTPSSEQVVPNCSPFVVVDEAKSKIEVKEIPDDEKPPISYALRRKNRTLDSPESPDVKELQLFDEEQIFA